MSWNDGVRRGGLEISYWSGLARLRERRSSGHGAVLRFERVRPRRAAAFQPLRVSEITPQGLDRLIRAVRRWDYDILSVEDALARLQQSSPFRRFVCLTFDGGYRDMVDHAYPVLAQQAAPFTLYLPSSFPDRLGEAWWLALEAVIAANARLALVIDGRDVRLTCATIAEKYRVFDYLAGWLRTLNADKRATAIGDLCGRYHVDLRALSDAATMTWPDIRQLADDPLVSVGSATVSYPVLTALRADDAEREMKMGRAVIEAALGRSVGDFAYPFGDAGAVGPREIAIAAQAGFTTAMTARPGLLRADALLQPMALPRVSWDGRHALRLLRVVLSGAMPGSRSRGGDG